MSALLEMREITKSFPGVLALDEVDFELESGEVHVLLGENKPRAPGRMVVNLRSGKIRGAGSEKNPARR